MKTKALMMLSFILISFQSVADDSCKHDGMNFRCVKVLRVYDGDTLFVTVPGIHPLLGENIGVRVRGLDTAEVSTKNSCEKRVGLYTKEQVAKLVMKAKRVDLINVSREKYFRILADVIVDGRSLSAHLMSKGLAYSYNGGTKTPPDWCGVEKSKIRVPASLEEEK